MLIKRTILIGTDEIVYWTSKTDSKRWIVLLHGAGMDHHMFDCQASVLVGRFNLIMWDAPGHGASASAGPGHSMEGLVENVLDILGKENIKRAIFLGQSMGGNLAQEIAFCHPNLVETMILIGCTRNTSKLTSLERLSLRLAPALLRWYPWKLLVRQSANACGIKPEVRKYAEASLLHTGRHNFLKTMISTMACLHEEPGYRYGKPFLLLCGEYDKTGNIKKMAYEWPKLEPDCEMRIVEAASHNANQDNPDKVNSLILGFLDKLEQN